MKIQTTPVGYKKNKDELEIRIAERVIILEELQRARDLGDLSENGAYHAAREKQSFNEGRIKELEYFLKNAEVIEKQDTGEVGVGSNIKLNINGILKEYSIVGSSEADLASGKLSVDSPVAKALIGKKQGDQVEITTPSGDVKYKILEVN